MSLSWCSMAVMRSERPSCVECTSCTSSYVFDEVWKFREFEKQLFCSYLRHVTKGHQVLRQLSLIPPNTTHSEIHLSLHQLGVETRLLIDSQQELSLMLSDFPEVGFFHQLSILVDEPRLTEHVGSRVFQLETIPLVRNLLEFSPVWLVVCPA